MNSESARAHTHTYSLCYSIVIRHNQCFSMKISKVKVHEQAHLPKVGSSKLNMFLFLEDSRLWGGEQSQSTDWKKKNKTSYQRTEKEAHPAAQNSTCSEVKANNTEKKLLNILPVSYQSLYSTDDGFVDIYSARSLLLRKKNAFYWASPTHCNFVHMITININSKSHATESQSTSSTTGQRFALTSDPLCCISIIAHPRCMTARTVWPQSLPHDTLCPQQLPVTGPEMFPRWHLAYQLCIEFRRVGPCGRQCNECD